MDRYKTTFETWDKLALAYQEKFMDLHLYDDTYDTFCGLVEKPGATLLEIGCGPGNITKYLLSKRPDFKIEAIDVAPHMAELAQANNPSAYCQVMDARELDKLSLKYDAVMCGFCMPYLSKEDCMKLIKDCASILSNGGIFYFSTIEGDYSTSGLETSSSGNSMFVYYYQEAFFQKELQAHNFAPIDVIQKIYSPPGGTSATHLVFIVRKQD